MALEGAALRGKILEGRTIEGKKIWVLESGQISRDARLTVSMKNAEAGLCAHSKCPTGDEANSRSKQVPIRVVGGDRLCSTNPEA